MKAYKNTSIPELLEVIRSLDHKAENLVDLPKNDNGQYCIPVDIFALEYMGGGIAASCYIRNVKVGRAVNKQLKGLGYYTSIIRVRAHSIFFWVSCSPQENMKKYGSYM